MLGIAALAVVGLGVYLIASEDDDDSDGTTTVGDDNAETTNGDPTEPAHTFISAWADADCDAMEAVIAEQSRESVDLCASPDADDRDASVDSVDVQSQDENEAVLLVTGSVESCYLNDCNRTELNDEVTVIDEDGDWKISRWVLEDGSEMIQRDDTGHGDDLDDQYLEDDSRNYEDDYPGYES